VVSRIQPPHGLSVFLSAQGIEPSKFGKSQRFHFDSLVKPSEKAAEPVEESIDVLRSGMVRIPSRHKL
jgi:hypothetical protein